MKKRIFKYKDNRLYDTGTYRRSRSSIYWDRVGAILSKVFIAMLCILIIIGAVFAYIKEFEIRKQEAENVHKEQILREKELEIEQYKLTEEYKQEEANKKRRAEIEKAIEYQKQEEKKSQENIARSLYPIGTYVYSKEIGEFGRVNGYDGLNIHTENFDFSIDENIYEENKNNNDVVMMLSGRQYHNKTIN